jgi:hypothetical protein
MLRKPTRASRGGAVRQFGCTENRCVARAGAAWTRWRRALAFAGALALSGCGGRIWLDHASAGGTTLRWYTRETTIDDVQARAEEHCSRFDKTARLLDEFEDQDVTTAHFACG